MENNEEKFENYFQFLSTKKNWGDPKSADLRLTTPVYPQMYSVYLLYNANTSTDFLVSVLTKFFHKNTSQAVKIALEIVKEGRSLCATYTRDAAETKVMHVLEYAQGQQQDVKCIMQKGDANVIKKS